MLIVFLITFTITIINCSLVIFYTIRTRKDLERIQAIRQAMNRDLWELQRKRNS